MMFSEPEDAALPIGTVFCHKRDNHRQVCDTETGRMRRMNVLYVVVHREVGACTRPLFSST